MKRIFLPLSALFLFACEEETMLKNASCSMPCYSGPENTKNIGNCREGTPVCENNVLVECLGQVLPSYEVCDNIDNNCDGQIDNSVVEEEILSRCQPDNLEPYIVNWDSTCTFGEKKCISGEIQCVGAITPTEELCDLKDNDCNGIVDDIIPTDLCYSGNFSEIVSGGSCKAGVLVCRLGTEVCVGEVLPQPEICNDYIDNNCNGKIDDVVSTSSNSKGIDVVLVIDRSTSMSDEIAGIRRAVQTFLGRHNTENIRVAAIDVPGVNQETGGSSIYPVINFDFQNPSLASILVGSIRADQRGVELSYDALYGLTDDTFGLSWKPGAEKIALFFGDEHAQSEVPYTEIQVANALTNFGIRSYFFVEPVHQWGYDEIVLQTGGAFYDLGRVTTDLELTLDQVIIERCD